MSTDKVINYYRKFKSKEAPFWMLPLLLLVIPYIILALLLLPFVIIKDIFFPGTEKNVAKFWSNQEVQMIIGYDRNNANAVRVVNTLTDQFGSIIVTYDWSKTKHVKLHKLLKQKASSDRNKLLAFKYGIDYDSVVTPPFGDSEDPCLIYAVGISKKYSQLSFVSAMPRLDDWYNPDKVLPEEEFYKDITGAVKADSSSPSLVK